jgi:hypothetical protein
MSQKYPGGFITKNYVAPTPSSAPGIWTLDQQLQAQKAGIWPFGGPFNYIEDVFSTYLYTGNGSTQTITNGVNLSGNGGAVWIKCRNTAGESHVLVDTVRGAPNALRPNSTAASVNDAGRVSAFTTSGFTTGADGETNGTSKTYVSWTFRKQPKFFDVVTYTGDGNTSKTISHNLGSVPGCIIVKCTSTTGNWRVYHVSQGATKYANLNETIAFQTVTSIWNDTAPTSTNFTVGNNASVNGSGETFVAYLFAHDAGGFGPTGTDNVISCGSYVGDGGAGTTSINLGYEPQWVLVKDVSGADNWVLIDNMRGFANESNTANDARLQPNTSNSESLIGALDPTATGFKTTLYSNINTAGRTYIYVAIRRGPMAVPTTGTSVFAPVAYTEILSTQTLTSGWPVDLEMEASRNNATGFYWTDRLRGSTQANTAFLASFDTGAESSFGVTPLLFDNSTGLTITNGGGFNNTSGRTDIVYMFRRAPSFFDEVCYTGTGSAMSITHNLGVGPELVIVKRRNSTSDWLVAAKINSTQYTVGNSGNELRINSTGGGTTTYYDYATYFNSTTFQTGAFWTTPNVNTATYVAYLFATCPGVSKVGTYTGTGATQTINCGFTGGARFVLIKRTDSTGDWYVWDSARGIIAGNDPYLLLNSSAAEVTGTDYIDTAATGFEISSTAPAAINANGGTFIFLAIA